MSQTEGKEAIRSCSEDSGLCCNDTEKFGCSGYEVGLCALFYVSPGYHTMCCGVCCMY